MKTIGVEPPSYSKLKNRQQSLRVGVRAWRVMDGLAAPKMPHLIKNNKVVHTLVMCRDMRSIVSKVGISFGAVQSILTDILGMSKV